MTLTARPPLTHTLNALEHGAPLLRADAVALLSAGGTDLARLMALASARRRPSPFITYSRKVFIPLTNLCRDVCGYCTFARSASDPKAHTMTPDEVLAVARAGQAVGCKEALFSLGERPEERHPAMRETLRHLGYASTTHYLAAMCDLVFRETGLLPHANCGVLNRNELELLAPHNASMGLMLESASPRLLEKGQAHWACPGKAPDLRTQTIRTAAEVGVAFTTGLLIGIGETLDERVDTLYALRDLAADTGNVQEIIVQNFRAKADTRFRNGPPRPAAQGEPPQESDPTGAMARAGTIEPSALEMARTIAVARLILGPDANIQAPPNLTPEAYAFYLLAGINDWGGVSPITRDHINPEAAWPALDDLRSVTADAGFVLRERLAIYPAYQTPRFLRPAIATRVQELVGPDGLAKENAPC
ncbi:MAG: 7,8-didemethyl-8-hydroxy-5-deazariboflavin synthase subunit CofG [Proteobacteria bacterium]|nr:7,8-didemethyl-8-hydroxy-5-deazariboflavin synthase subunit CofG [Pseudomonadota bacterium]